MSRRKSDSGRQAIAWLATVIVVVIGAAATGVVIVAGAERQIEPWLVWGICFSFIIVTMVLWNVRWEEPLNQLKFWLSYREIEDPTDGYSAARRSIETREKFGSQKPPTLESVRDAAEHGGAWVPKASQQRQRPNNK